jgi:hypothetical protein
MTDAIAREVSWLSHRADQRHTFRPVHGERGTGAGAAVGALFSARSTGSNRRLCFPPFRRIQRLRGAHVAEPCADVLVAVKGIPVLAILGNHDHWNNAAIVEAALKDRGIEVLRNRSIPLERGYGRIWIAGVDDALVGAADLGKTLRDVPRSETTLLLAHEPDFAD